ncbi:hypothetical protein L7F22_045258 [Adiantum nelumboides]|nr:hypothetical protein [Adiantum nelumboides]
MWRITIRLLSDTNNIFSNSSSRVLKRCSLSSQVSFSVQSNKEEYRFWAPLCSHQQRRFYRIGPPLFTQQICFSVSHFTAQRQATLRLTGSSRDYNQHLLGVISRAFHKNSHFLVQDCRCLASWPSSIFSACKVKGSGALQFSRSDFRTQLHSAALAVSFDDPQETTFCHMPSSEDQMSSKPAEDQIVMENDTLSAQAITEFNYARFSPPSSPSFLEALAVPASNPQPEVSSLRECMDEMNAQTFPIENTRATKIQKILDQKGQKLRSRQLKVESCAWRRAIDDYRKQIAQMCKNQRAPSLPFMKSLFLSWFEPLTKAITAEQEAYKNGKVIVERRYGPYLDLLPADMLAVITMHKTVAKLLTDDVYGGLKVIIPIMSIGEAVEEETGHYANNCPQKKRPADSEDKEDRKGKRPMAGLVPNMVGDKPSSDASELCRAWGKVRDQSVLIFFDPGAKANFISPELASRLGIRSDEMGYTAEAGLACPGHTEAVTPIIGKLRLHIQSYVDAEEFYIMPLDGCDVLLGIPWLFRV